MQCPKCDAGIPLNGPVVRAHCDKCQSDIELNPRFWRLLARDIYGDVAFRLKEDQGYNAAISEKYEFKLLLGRQQPACLDCGRTLALRPEASTPYIQTCAACGGQNPVVPAPGWLVEDFPPPRLLVNAEIQEASAAGKAPDAIPTSAPIAFACPQCGGSLTVDGGDRVVPCRFCGIKVYLPDDLWFRMHPARKKARWFILFGDAPDTYMDRQPRLLQRISPYIVKMNVRD